MQVTSIEVGGLTRWETVAGDDTIFLVARSEDHAETICNDLVALAESGT